MTLQQLLTAHSVLGLVAAVVLIGVDSVIGTVQAFAGKVFRWTLLPRFLERHILPQVGGLIVVALVQYFAQHTLGWIYGTAMSVVFWGAVVYVNLALLRDILAKFGIPIPPLPTSSSGKSA